MEVQLIYNKSSKLNTNLIAGIHFRDDILADSDSDNELQEDILMGTEDQPTERSKNKSYGKQEKYIYENSENIVDLADIKAMNSIGCKY